MRIDKSLLSSDLTLEQVDDVVDGFVLQTSQVSMLAFVVES